MTNFLMAALRLCPSASVARCSTLWGRPFLGSTGDLRAAAAVSFLAAICGPLLILGCGGGASSTEVVDAQTDADGSATTGGERASVSTSPPPARPTDATLDAFFDEAQMQVRRCTPSRSGTAIMEVLIRGRDGKVVEAKVDAITLNPEEQKCVSDALYAQRMSPFQIEALLVRYPLAVGGSLPGNVGDQESEGTLDPQAVEAEVFRHADDLQRCYDECCGTDPHAVGQLELQFTVGKLGAITKSHVLKSTLGKPSMHACLLDAMKQWRFPKPKGGDVVIRYPLRFYPAE